MDDFFVFKPTNWDCVVDARVVSNNKRENLIRDAYESGKRLRLDVRGIQQVISTGVVSASCIAIDARV